MSAKIALLGNPNCGKTTLFNALTGSNQFVGNWPGVTVEKKEGKLKGNKEITITDLPGIYSLSPYTLEEVVSRNYLVKENPTVILNIIDGTNLERNLYLTTQLLEFGIPVIVAVNMLDLLEKGKDKVHIDKLSKELGCEVVSISALKGTGIDNLISKLVDYSKNSKSTAITHKFDLRVENAIETIEERLATDSPQERFLAIKLLENDSKVDELINKKVDVADVISQLEDEFDDDTESIITNERYTYISSIIGKCFTHNSKGKLSVTDKIDRIVTNRFLALPIFAAIMFLVYYISVTTWGDVLTNWANDGVFGDGWHLFGIGTSAYEDAAGEYSRADQIIAAITDGKNEVDIVDDEDAVVEHVAITDDVKSDAEAILEDDEPDPANFGVWVPGVPGLLESGLDAINCADWLKSLILDGIVAGVGAVLGFVPQMLLLFLFLAFLEACGYMARVAFIMDRIFRKFGLSGKSFIPMLIGSGCGVPGIMASRTIENDRDRKMTIMTTTFIPCGAKLPVIALIAGAFFGGAWWVAPSAYFVGVAAVIISGIMLKKTKMFAGEPAPFVMELPAYHMPTVGNVLRSVWERGWSFIKKAGTIILLSTIVLWFLQNFGFVDGSFAMLEEEQLDNSILAVIGNAINFLFIPIWGNVEGGWKLAVAAITGLIAKENVVGTLGVLFVQTSDVAEDGTEYWAQFAAMVPAVAGYAFLIFNLLCAPCFAALGAIKREMNNAKWFWFAVAYQTGFAYAVSLCIYQFGKFFLLGSFGIGTVAAVIVLAGLLYFLFRPTPKVKYDVEAAI